MPYFLESNCYLSSYGIRNALERNMQGKFVFNSQVISLPGQAYDMKELYKLFAIHHPSFTAEQLYELSKELDCTIYLNTILDCSVRVSEKCFILKNNIEFDVDGIDSAIESFMTKDFIPIREIDSFLSFPTSGYVWNEYLLESFVRLFSKKYRLLNNGVSMSNISGAIVKKTGMIKEFVDVCAEILAYSNTTLDKSNALNFLADKNLITRRSYKDIDIAIRKAKQIRER